MAFVTLELYDIFFKQGYYYYVTEAIDQKVKFIGLKKLGDGSVARFHGDMDETFDWTGDLQIVSNLMDIQDTDIAEHIKTIDYTIKTMNGLI